MSWEGGWKYMKLFNLQLPSPHQLRGDPQLTKTALCGTKSPEVLGEARRLGEHVRAQQHEGAVLGHPSADASVT